MKLELTFVREKDTPNTVRFKEVREGGWRPGERPTVGQLYVLKPIAGDAQELRVTIEQTK